MFLISRIIDSIQFIIYLYPQPNMKRSDLLFIFLTSDEMDSGTLFDLVGNTPNEASSTFLPDLNPLRAMRKMGTKERGQNLKPFILNLLANTLAPPATTAAARSPPAMVCMQNTLGRTKL